MWLLAACAWRLLGGARHWAQWYLAIPLGVILIAVGTLYLRAPPRDPGEIVGPRPLSDVGARLLNFTVRRHPVAQ